jgi:uncharacterized protein (TIGR02246 family)
MRTHPAFRIRVCLVGSLVFGAIGLALGGSMALTEGQPPPTKGRSASGVIGGGSNDRPADRDSVQKAIDGFVAAFQKGDAKTVAALWTAEGEYTSDDGTSFRGRAALEKAYSDFFAKSPNNKLDVEIETIRFPSRDTAVVEGHFKLRKAKDSELNVSQCNFLYARENGQWLIAIARELPSDGLALRDLEWLIGSWEAKREGTAVTTRYEWTKNKTFIRCQFSITKDGETQTGMQMIGKMPSTGGLHIWTFEDAGGIGDADIERDGKKWVHNARGSTADGRVVTATNILTPIDNDSFLWQSVQRTVDEEAQPDQPPIKVNRVKGK